MPKKEVSKWSGSHKVCTRGRVPHLDGIVQSAAGKPPIRTPRNSIGYPTMATQQPGRSPAITLPNGHEGIGARTGEPAPIRVPGYVIEGDRVALHYPCTLTALYIPHPQGAIFTPAEQAATTGHESKIMHNGGMPMECHTRAALFDVPEPDRLITAATGQQVPIGAPGH